VSLPDRPQDIEYSILYGGDALAVPPLAGGRGGSSSLRVSAVS